MQIRIGNSMVSSAICEEHARVSFSKTFKINLSVFEKLKSRVYVFPKLHKKSYYYLCIQLYLYRVQFGKKTGVSFFKTVQKS